MMERTWRQVYENQIFTSPDDTSCLNIRVSVTPDGVNVITDIRKYVGKKATRLGVGLFPDELKWVLDNVGTVMSCERQFDFRKLKIEFENSMITVIVIKSDWTEQKMYFNKDQVTRLHEMKGELQIAIENAMQFVSHM